MTPSAWKSPWSWLPSATATLLAFFLFWGYLRPIDWDDLGWHIRLGEWILTHRAVPHTNVLVWTTPEHPFVPHEWLSEVLFALLDRAGGMRLLLVVRALAFLSTLLLLVRLGRRAGAEPLALAALTFAAGWGIGTQATLRPWLFSNLLLAIQLTLLDRARRGEAAQTHHALWALPPLYLLWVNLHGGFLVGLGVLALGLADRVWAAPPGERRRAVLFRHAGVLAASLGACLVTPLGPGILLFPLRYLFAPDDGTGIRLMKQSITEWLPIQPIGTIDGGVWIALLAGVAASLAFVAAARRDSRAWLALAMLLLCLRETRHLAMATILAFPVLSAWILAPLAARLRAATSGPLARLGAHSRLESIPRTGFTALVSLFAVGLFLTWRAGPDFERRVVEPDRYPFDAFAAVRARAPRRLFHFYEYCGPIAWKLPGQPLFVVGIHDAQPESLFSDYLRVIHLLDDWEEPLRRWDVDAVLMPSGHPLVAALETKGWQVGYGDGQATLLVPSDS